MCLFVLPIGDKVVQSHQIMQDYTESSKFQNHRVKCKLAHLQILFLSSPPQRGGLNQIFAPSLQLDGWIHIFGSVRNLESSSPYNEQ